jgi:dihydroorotate dehydrogenase electron transfer subunit
MNNKLDMKIEKSFPLIKIEKNKSRGILQFNIGEKNICPGQFFMINYKLNQKPVSVYDFENGIISFLIESRGESTKAMIDAKNGDFFGLTGPLGNHFLTEDHKKFLLIAGGVGVAPVLFLAKELNKKNSDYILLIGEKTKENIIYQKEFEKLKLNEIIVYTDDGSFGKKGFPTEELNALLDENRFDSACICGPEIMMKIAIEKIIQKSEVNIQVCMERYMKCGIGLCGSCVLDDIGLRVCADGSVFDYEKTLKASKEFGNYKRDKSGVIEKL